MQPSNLPPSGPPSGRPRLFIPDTSPVDNAAMPPTDEPAPAPEPKAKPKKRKTKRLPNFLRIEEQFKLLKTCADEVAFYDAPRTRGRTKAGSKVSAAKRDWLFVLVGIRAGLRISEMCDLEIEHVDIHGMSIFVYRGKGDVDRYVPITPDLREPLIEMIGGRTSGPVFMTDNGAPMIKVTMSGRMARLGNLAGFTKKLKPHTLRHTAAIRMLESGATIAEVRDFLGHSSISVTDRYTHCVPENLRASVDRAARSCPKTPNQTQSS